MTDYRLLVDIWVKKEFEDKFEERMETFLTRGSFRFFHPDFDNRLVLALKRECSPVDLDMHSTRYPVADILQSRKGRHPDKSSSNGSTHCHYVHLWTMPDLEDLHLARRMQYCSEDSEYMGLDELVERETQNLVRRVRWQLQPSDPNPDSLFVLKTCRFEYGRLGEYLLRIRGLIPAMKRKDWDQLGQFQQVTGTLNTVTEFWQTEDKDWTSSSSELWEGLLAGRIEGEELPFWPEENEIIPIWWNHEIFECPRYFKRPSFAERRDKFIGFLRKAS